MSWDKMGKLLRRYPLPLPQPRIAKPYCPA
jgi:hypothetical protein